MILKEAFAKIAIFFNHLGFIAIVALGFGVEIATATSSIPLVVLYICFLLSGDWQKKMRLFLHPVALIAVIFWLWILISGCYHLIATDDSLHNQLTTIIKYSRVFIIWMIIYFIDNHRRFMAVIVAIALGVIINLVAIWANYFLLPVNHAIIFSHHADWPAAQNHFQFAFFTLVFAFSCFIWATFNKLSTKQRVLLIILGVIALITEMGLNSARTGYVMELVCALLFYSLRYRLKGAIFALIFCLLAVFIAYFTSSVFQKRINMAVNNVALYQQGQSNQTPVGLRLYFYQISLALIKSAPKRIILGYGNGNFKSATKNYLARHKQQFSHHFVIKPFSDPHNQFLLLLIESGMVGLGLFLALLVIFSRHCYFLGYPWGYIGYVVVIGMVVGCLFNSWFRDFNPSMIFIAYVGLLVAPVHDKFKQTGNSLTPDKQ